MASRTALIVGAGIGGLAAAIALERAGWQVRVFERAASPRELGFALSLAPNAILALRELGVAGPVIADGSITGVAELRTSGGRLLKRFDLGAALTRTPAVMALRAALHGALLNAVDRTSLALGSEAAGLDLDDDHVVLRLQDGRLERGDVLVGADGVGSAIRRLLHPTEPPPRRSGFFAIRGVAYGPGARLGSLSVVGYLAHAVEAAVIRAGGQAVYWYMSLLAEDVRADTHDLRAIAERSATVLDETFRATVHETRSEDMRLDELCDRDPLDEWGRGRVTLLGDAAHPMLPYTGQGAAQALEDAVALGLVLGSGDHVVDALRRYERVRSGRTRGLVKRGRRIARFTTTKSPFVNWLRPAVIRLVPAKTMASAFLLADTTDPHRALRSPASGC